MSKSASYNVVVDWFDSRFYKKRWLYVESIYYKAVIPSNGSLDIGVTVRQGNIANFDNMEIRLYHISSPEGEGKGKMFCFLNNRPIVPTIGYVTIPTPVHLGFPKYPSVGSIVVFGFDVGSILNIGKKMNFKFVWNGPELRIKTIELYVVGY